MTVGKTKIRKKKEERRNFLLLKYPPTVSLSSGVVFARLCWVRTDFIRQGIFPLTTRQPRQTTRRANGEKNNRKNIYKQQYIASSSSSPTAAAPTTNGIQWGKKKKKLKRTRALRNKSTRRCYAEFRQNPHNCANKHGR